MRAFCAAYLKVAISHFVVQIVDSNLGAASEVSAVSLLHPSYYAAVQQTLQPSHSSHTNHRGHHVHHSLPDHIVRGGLPHIGHAPNLCHPVISIHPAKLLMYACFLLVHIHRFITTVLQAAMPWSAIRFSRFARRSAAYRCLPVVRTHRRSKDRSWRNAGAGSGRNMHLQSI